MKTWRNLLAVCGLCVAAGTVQAIELEPWVDDWMISKEIVLTDPDASSPTDPRATSNGSNYIAVWRARSNTLGSPAIVGVILDAAGEPVPNSRFAIPILKSGSDGDLEVASNGTDYLVTWRELFDNQGIPGVTQLYAARVTADGSVLDGEPVQLRSVSSSMRLASPCVASDGEQYLIAWSEYLRDEFAPGGDPNSSRKVYTQRIGNDGSVLQTQPDQ